ncbi:MAG: bifunctional UDP-N-acetylglucosamine diphosphorylase/glucosamine-1-phosphate N-acetyltransferase GlmU [Acidobacteria bacterium]|nr:bifunctional UDP-N-acetylglucosamine diphosphorylase/glucosamine-1-phosphate N-acetyltransferase GlmU [Acidobacteriota bacterium]
MTVHALVLAAGKGTRMKSARAKVLHQAFGLPLLEHLLRSLETLGLRTPTVVVGHRAEDVEAAFQGRGLAFVRQVPPLGTGHAVRAAQDAWSRHAGTLLVLNGDLPLLRSETLAALLETHRSRGAAATLLTAVLTDAGDYGRVLRDPSGAVRAVVEAKDASAEERAVREINAGVYAFDVAALVGPLEALSPRNAQGEYYLTDVVASMVAAGRPVAAFATPDPSEALGVNTLEELAAVSRLLRERRTRVLLAAGVVLEDPTTIHVGPDAVVEPDAVIRPFTFLEGRTTVRSGAAVGPFVRLVDTEVGPGAQILDHCLLREAVVASGASVGPFAHVRPETVIGAGARVGNFVELKKTRLGAGAKAPHLSYLGDAEIGERVNVGAGTITCNYDGTSKHPTRIGAGAFVGSNTTLVAPLTVGPGAYVGAGSTITEDVPPDALAVARARQVSKEGWARARRERLAREKADKEAGKG